MTTTLSQVFLIDDEPLALKRLSRLLSETGQVEIAGQESDPENALALLQQPKLRNQLDAIFLDIQMPVMNGFELLEKLDWQPFVIFTTAYDEYALQAFAVNSIDYLLKPIEMEHLNRALQKLAQRKLQAETPDFRQVLAQLTSAMKVPKINALTRIASRVGERIRFFECNQITHFFAQDKLTYAATDSGNHVVDRTIAELEQELDSETFVRIHRATLLNLNFVEEVHTWFSGRLIVRLKDSKRTELTVARERAKELKDKLRF